MPIRTALFTWVTATTRILKISESAKGLGPWPSELPLSSECMSPISVEKSVMLD